MDLVQNLRKILIESGKIIFQGLYSHYIKPKEKPTTKKQDNSSLTMSSQSPLTEKSPHTTIVTSSQGTTEKIIMEKTTEDIVAHVREWAIDRVGDLHEEVYKNKKDMRNLDDACAVYQEFVEWIEPESKELDIISLEQET